MKALVYFGNFAYKLPYVSIEFGFNNEHVSLVGWFLVERVIKRVIEADHEWWYLEVLTPCK